MAEKRKLSDQSPERFFGTKHAKNTSMWPYWSDGQVRHLKQNCNLPPGILCVDTYEVEAACRPLGEILDQIGETETFKISHKKFFYYSGFKNGLTYLLGQIHLLSGDEAILIHGMPNIGKSALAQNLAYHLSSKDGAATVVKMNNGVKLSPEGSTEMLWNYLDKPGWVILDQVNVNRLERENLKDWLENINRKTPLIIFTSGCYAPPARCWEEDDAFPLRVIDMRIDIVGLERIKKDLDSDINMDDILEVTSVFGHAWKLIRASVNTKEEMHEKVYKEFDFAIFLRLNPNILLVLWPQYCTANTLDTKPVYKISPSKVDILGHAKGFENDHERTMLFINWLRIDGDGNQGHGFYEHTEYFYYFPLVEKLHVGLKQAFEISPVDKLLQLRNDYHVEETKCFGSARMRCAFEAIIRMKLHLHCRDNKCGLSMDERRGVKIHEVDDILEPISVDELCQMLEDQRAANSKKKYVWCDLIARNDRFPGYDFASVQMEGGKYLSFELFQATISKGILHKRTASMEVVLEYILSKIPDDAFYLNTKVASYFLCPYEFNRLCEEKVTFGRNGHHAQVINYHV